MCQKYIYFTLKSSFSSSSSKSSSKNDLSTVIIDCIIITRQIEAVTFLDGSSNTLVSDSDSVNSLYGKYSEFTSE